jgi:hypothetical protein
MISARWRRQERLARPDEFGLRPAHELLMLISHDRLIHFTVLEHRRTVDAAKPSLA